MTSQPYLPAAEELEEILRIQKLDERVYGDIDLNRLTIYGIHWLKDRGIPITIERLSVVLFKLFPAKFSMAEFKTFPDLLRTQRAVLQLRPKYRNWAKGRVKEGNITFTQDGLHALEQVKSLLSRGPDEIPPDEGRRSVPTPRDIGLKWIAVIEASNLYRRYNSNDIDEDAIWDFYDLLHASEDTDVSTLYSNLSRLESYAKSLERADIIEFLNWIRTEFHQHL